MRVKAERALSQRPVFVYASRCAGVLVVSGISPGYHHITDAIDKIDYVKMQKILQLAYFPVCRFADDV